jgi:sulfate permease, SulP family
LRVSSIFGLGDSLRFYSRKDGVSDLSAGIITAILLVPQGIAFALLAGLPAQAGLYASILPMLVYALLGSSRTLSVGPVSVAAIMVSTALQSAAGDAMANAAILAFEGGLFLWILSALRFGSLFNLINHSVLSGFTAGAAILIVLSQLPHLIGAPPSSHHAGFAALRDIPALFLQTDNTTLIIGLLSILALWIFNRSLKRILTHWGLSDALATIAARLGPLFVVIATAVVVILLHPANVKTVGFVPSGLPTISFEFTWTGNWLRLAPSAFFIALIGYVESIAIAKALATKRHESVNAQCELVALGAANIAAAFSATMPVAGGFSRTMVNHSAGARTQLASIVTALIIAAVIVFFTDWFQPIPKAALAAIIIVAVLPLIEFRSHLNWALGRRGATVVFLGTFFGVLLLGIEIGLALGLILSLLRRGLIGARRFPVKRGG